MQRPTDCGLLRIKLDLKVPPPIVGLLCALCVWLLARHAPGLALTIPWRVPIAITLVVVGLCFDATGIYAFIQDKTTINPMKPTSTSTVVTGGIYRFSRNPMYVGMLFILTGWAVFLGNPLALLPLAAFVAYIDRFQIRPEERILLERFGREYTDYMRSVRRWL